MYRASRKINQFWVLGKRAFGYFPIKSKSGNNLRIALLKHPPKLAQLPAAIIVVALEP
jgi:hypothetical protein